MDRENPEGGASTEIRQGSEAVSYDPARASEALLARIRELHAAGRSAEDIAALVLTTEPENLAFRGAVLVEIILHQLRYGTEEKNQ